MAGNTILVVDDEQRMRKLVRDFLTKQNFRVLEAADGECIGYAISATGFMVG